jgi:uncharacterized membrane protein
VLEKKGMVFLKKLNVYLLVGIVGGVLYYLIEILYRGYSHWSMFLLGGIAFLFCGIQGRAVKWRDPLIKQVIRCGIFITATELITGIIVNRWLRLNVWDYSDLPFNLMGQICPYFILAFMGLCIIAIPFSGYLMYWLTGELRPPKMHLFRPQSTDSDQSC